MAKTHVEMTVESDDGDGDVSGSASDTSNEEDDSLASTKGLANVMANILNKKVPKHKQVILAKALTEKEIKKRKKAQTDENKKDDDEDDENTVSKASLEKKRMWEEMGRAKPSPLEREKERNLQKIAQRGVVQLFNAVRKQQKLLEENMSEAGPSVRKQSKVMAKMTKGSFLDMLKDTNKGASEQKKKVNLEAEDTGEKKWSILREDFMMGGKMKDWDKKSSDEDSGNENQHNMEDSDSDNG